MRGGESHPRVHPSCGDNHKQVPTSADLFSAQFNIHQNYQTDSNTSNHDHAAALESTDKSTDLKHWQIFQISMQYLFTFNNNNNIFPDTMIAYVKVTTTHGLLLF